jgi:hypothetical protein
MTDPARTDDYITTMSRDRQEGRRRMRTFTGLYVDPFQLRAGQIVIEDIAHHTALINRYTGASPKPYSVAQHCVWVSDRLVPQGRTMALAGLLHDASEAYFNDIASPVKRNPLMAAYARQEHATAKLIFCRFGLDPDLLALVKPTDDDAFYAEVKTWWGRKRFVTPWPWERAEREFLARFRQLTA